MVEEYLGGCDVLGAGELSPAQRAAQTSKALFLAKQKAAPLIAKARAAGVKAIQHGNVAMKASKTLLATKAKLHPSKHPQVDASAKKAAQVGQRALSSGSKALASTKLDLPSLQRLLPPTMLHGDVIGSGVFSDLGRALEDLFGGGKQSESSPPTQIVVNTLPAPSAPPSAPAPTPAATDNLSATTNATAQAADSAAAAAAPAVAAVDAAQAADTAAQADATTASAAAPVTPSSPDEQQHGVIDVSPAKKEKSVIVSPDLPSNGRPKKGWSQARPALAAVEETNRRWLGICALGFVGLAALAIWSSK